MHRIGFILLGMASLVASGVIMDNQIGRIGLRATSGLGLQTVQGIRGGVLGNTMSRVELVRQKLVLEILQQVHKPLQQRDLLTLDDPTVITNENLYMRPLTQEMHLVLEMIRNNQMLDKQTVWVIHSDEHVLQMIGLYRLMVTARDFDTLLRLMVYARQNVNTEMFVNSLILALAERDDTCMLIVPALYEILPQVYQEQSVIDQVSRLDTGVSSLRPQLLDLVGRQRYQNQGGLLNVLNRSQMWMPWRELHKQMSYRKVIGGTVQQQQDLASDKLVITLPGSGLLSEDIGLKAYVNILIDQLIANQDVISNSNQQRDTMGRNYVGGRGQFDMDDMRVGRMNSRRSNIIGLRQGGVTNRGQDVGMQGNRYGMGGRSRIIDEEDDVDMMTMENRRNRQMGGRDLREQQRGINTVSVNDARLLFVGRRRKNPNNVVSLNQRSYNDEDDMISGGRRVSKERKNGKQERQRMYQNNDDDEIEYMQRMNQVNGQDYRVNPLEDDDASGFILYNMNRRKNGMNVITHDDWRQRKLANDYYGNYDVVQGQGMGRGRNDFLNIVHGGRMGQRQTTYDDDVMYRGYVNDGRQVRDKIVYEEDDDDEDVEQQIRNIRNQRVNTGYSGLDGQRNYQRDNNYQRGNQGQQEQMRGRLGVDSSTGRRYRRSVDYDVTDMSTDDISLTGKLLLHTMQQIVARLNIERISLGLPQLVEDLQNNKMAGLLSQRMGSTNLHNYDVDTQTAHKIEDIIRQIDQVLEQKVGDISIMQHDKQINEIGLILAGQIQEVGLIDMLRDILQRPQQKGQIANLIENEAFQMLLAGIVQVVDRKVQQVYLKREKFISTVEGVNINNVKVDGLRTYLEMSEVDLSNLVSQNIDEVLRGQTKEVVGRVPRLNHENFNIKVDVTSDRQQQVVIRNLLVPKVDGAGNIIPMRQRRQNVIVLDITTAELQPGRNTLNIRSEDIAITARDTTPLTEIYQQVMQALKGGVPLQKDVLVGQTNMLPHRLLLPRGRVNGLPMILITVITPVETIVGSLQDRRNDLDLLLLDRLPLTYPLHCDLTNLDRVVTMPNLMVQNVKIYHDNQISTNVY
ncbi:fat-body protein 1-like [Cochliomyia hominivorax]